MPAYLYGIGIIDAEIGNDSQALGTIRFPEDIPIYEIPLSLNPEPKSSADNLRKHLAIAMEWLTGRREEKD